MKKVFFLSDTPPLKTKGAGISVLLFNMLSALRSNYDLTVITFCKEFYQYKHEIVEDNAEANLVICDDALTGMYRSIKLGIVKSIFQSLSFLISVPRIIRMARGNEQFFVTLIGASGRPLWKTLVLMILLPKSKHGLYIVDDLELINKNLNYRFENLIIKFFLPIVIKKSDFLITISTGLRDLYLNKYAKDSKVLFPHYKEIDKIALDEVDKDNFTFLFTGGLSLLYNDSLKAFAVALEDLKIANMKFRLIIQTYSNRSEFDKLNFNDTYVSYSSCKDRSELLAIYQQCDCFIVPYSFDRCNQGLVSTSFPQKIAEIIQYGKKILFYGPNYSSVGEFFRINNLKYVCNQDDKPSLQQLLTELYLDESDFNSFYEYAYKKDFSSNSVLTIFDRITS